MKKTGKDPLFRQKSAGILKMFVWTPCYRSSVITKNVKNEYVETRSF